MLPTPPIPTLPPQGGRHFRAHPSFSGGGAGGGGTVPPIPPPDGLFPGHNPLTILPFVSIVTPLFEDTELGQYHQRPQTRPPERATASSQQQRALAVPHVREEGPARHSQGRQGSRERCLPDRGPHHRPHGPQGHHPQEQGCPAQEPSERPYPGDVLKSVFPLQSWPAAAGCGG